MKSNLFFQIRNVRNVQRLFPLKTIVRVQSQYGRCLYVAPRQTGNDSVSSVSISTSQSLSIR